MANVLLFTSKSPLEETPDSLSVPIGLYNLRHVLRSNGMRCDVIDHQLDSESDYLEQVEQGLYDVIGISVTHWRMLDDLEFLYRLREIYRRNGKHCLFIAGGLQATINYRQWLESGFDLVCLGYAEETLLDVCRRLDRATLPFPQWLEGCDGVAYLEGGRMVHVPTPPLTGEKFEQLMYHSVIKMDLPYHRYWDFIRKRATGLLNANNRSYVIENGRLLTTSKCLARCGFCCCPDFLKEAQGSPVKPMSLPPEQVHGLILHLVNRYGARAVSINDEDFLIGTSAGNERAIRICELVIDSKRKGELPEEIRFSCQTRPNCFLTRDRDGNQGVNHRLMQVLQQAGFHNVTLGVETFSSRLLKSPSINKGISSEACHAVIAGLIENGLYTTINLILGIPESSTDELLESVDQVLQYMDKPCQISLAKHMFSFPGSAIFSSPDYPTHDDTFVNPADGEKMRIKKYFVPRDPELKELIDRLDAATQEELAGYRLAFGLPESALLPRIIISLLTFLAIARIKGDEALHARVTGKIRHFSEGLA